MKVKRIQPHYENLSDQFVLSGDDFMESTFHKQYYVLYKARTKTLCSRTQENAKRLLGPNVKISQIVDIKNAGSNNLHLIYGAVLKRMKYRPSILDEFIDEENLDYVDKKDSLSKVDDEDLLEFEDDLQIIKLSGNIDKDSVVTGDVIGLYGSQIKDDLFHVETVIYPELPHQPEKPLIGQDIYVVFMSGICFSTRPDDKRVLFALENFKQCICGETGLSTSTNENLDILKSLSRIVIAGDVIDFHIDDFEQQKVSEFADVDIDKDVIPQFDQFLETMLYNTHIDIMSGPNDPCSLMIPQQPIPRIMFQKASKFGDMFATVTNPYKFSLNGISFLGTSGQNITDLSKYTCGKSTLELMERTLTYGHIFPTSPDTVDGFPLENRDPLILSELPHVYFAGNQENFGTATISLDGKECVLISVPKFCKTKSVVLFNLRTLSAEEHLFQVEDDFSYRQVNEVDA